MEEICPFKRYPGWTRAYQVGKVGVRKMLWPTQLSCGCRCSCRMTPWARESKGSGSKSARAGRICLVADDIYAIRRVEQVPDTEIRHTS